MMLTICGTKETNSRNTSFGSVRDAILEKTNLNTHRTKNIGYCRAIKINEIGDHPDIIVDPSGFEGAKIPYKTDFDHGYKSIRKGDFVIEYGDRVAGVLSESEFHRLWEPIPATVKFVQDLQAMVAGAERGGQKADDDVEFWIDGCEYGVGRLTLADIKAFLAEQKGVV